MPSASKEVRVIGYAPAQRGWRASRRKMFALVVVSAVLLLAAGAYRSRQAIRSAWLQHWALSTACSPGTLVFMDSQPGNARSAPEVAILNTSYLAFAEQYRPPFSSTPPRATIFVGQLTTPSGIRRLVGIEAAKSSDDNGRTRLNVFATGCAPASLLRRPSSFLVMRVGSDYLDTTGVTAAARLFSGAQDPADHSHATFDFALGEQSVTFDIWLCDPAGGERDAWLKIEPRVPTPPTGPMTHREQHREK